MIYTSYFANIKKIPNNIEKISISRFPPSWADIDGELKELAPSADLLNRYKNGVTDEEEYRTEFLAQLNTLNPFETANKLDGKALLCYEKIGDFCHRHLVAEWLKSFGFKVEELPATQKSKNIKKKYINALGLFAC